jgi:addiction module RelE/StbE family toxin
VATVRWTEQAADDLSAICQFIGRDSPAAARSFAERVIETVELLENFPLSGRQVPELDDIELREVILGSYRLIYRFVGDDRLEVITIHHGARRLRSL